MFLIDSCKLAMLSWMVGLLELMILLVLDLTLLAGFPALLLSLLLIAQQIALGSQVIVATPISHSCSS